jgi:D-glycero-alpha-D-manno-heptose-7-phosphate kinase
LNLFRSWLEGKFISRKNLAIEAINLEQNILKEYVGSQDQVATALGGFNKIVFKKNSLFACKPIKLNKNKIINLEKWVTLFYTGVNRNSQKIEKTKMENLDQKKTYYKKIYSSVEKAEAILLLQNN